MLSQTPLVWFVVDSCKIVHSNPQQLETSVVWALGKTTVITRGESNAHLWTIYLWRKSKVRRPPLVSGRLFLVADQSFIATAEVESGRAVTYRPAPWSVRVALHAKPLGVAEFLTAAFCIAPPIPGQIAAQVTTDKDRVGFWRVVLDRPQLLLA